jgi:hypothetical protein
MCSDVVTEMEKRLDRFVSLLPIIEDATLIVLKGHLLIEEMLNDILYNSIALSKYIDEAKLSFYQKIMIARSLDPKGDASNGPWESLVSLNSLRNQLAHHLEPKDIDDRIDKFIFARFNGKKMKTFKSNKDRIEGLRKELFILSGYILGYHVCKKSLTS